MTTTSAARSGNPGRASQANAATIALGTMPALILLLALVGWPIVQAVWLSLSDWGGVGDLKWVGLENYTTVLSDPRTLRSLGTTLTYATASTCLIIVIATLLAAYASAGGKGSNFHRIVWFLPGIAPAAAASIFWANAFQPSTGALNLILGALGMGSRHAWLAEGSMALIPVIVVTVWTSVGFAFLIILGAMEQIDSSLYEAARIDGANAVSRFWSVTLPLARPTIVIVAILEFIWTFNGFTVIWAMTQGGPGSATSTLPVLVYKQAFQFTQFGRAAALSVVGGALLLAIGTVGLMLGGSRQR